MAARIDKLFYSYSSADEVLRTELEKHLTLLKREGVIETWSFRNIDAGTEWKKSIDSNLESATIVLLLISADFIASDYCWDIEMKRALERHESGDALVVPVILKPCDWKTAPFAKLQGLPEDARPVTNWRPRDRAWTNVVAGLRRVIQQANRSKPLPAPPTVAGNSASPSEKKVSAIERAKRVAQASQERKSRDARLQNEGVEAMRAESVAVFEHIGRIVQEIGQSSPELEMREGHRGDYCVVRVGRVTLNLYPYVTHPVTDSRLVYRLWLGGILLPEEEGKKFYPMKPKEHRERKYYFDLTESGEWGWRAGKNDPIVSSDELADHCVNELLDLQDGVESGRISFPELDW
jgi:hypothetical protein